METGESSSVACCCAKKLQSRESFSFSQKHLKVEIARDQVSQMFLQAVPNRNLNDSRFGLLLEFVINEFLLSLLEA